MKYLAAYALLTLGGKTDISSPHLIQKPQTSSLSSETSDRKSLMRTSTESSVASRERSCTSWSLRVKRESEVAPLLLLLPAPPRRKLLKSSKRRRKSPRRSPLLLPPRKQLTRISEISSVDAIALFNITRISLHNLSHITYISSHASSITSNNYHHTKRDSKSQQQPNYKRRLYWLFWQ